ncbi:MAG TPA: hypothetical protein PLD84_02825 [Chitinophagales bacterium]|nr:hypothetical protein [Chitinophagales bacterium]
MESDNQLEKYGGAYEIDFEINTGFIFRNEANYAREGEGFINKKCPDYLAESLTFTVHSLLIKYSKPFISSPDLSDKYLEYKYDRLTSGELIHLQVQNFKIDHFVLKLNHPISEPTQVVADGNEKKNYYYLFEYGEPLSITREMLENESFEMLFAFALRQCNLSYMDSFLQYHLDHSFDADLKGFIRFVVLIKRKFEEPLFSNGLTDALNQWLRENEINLKNSGTEKIKTYLTVDQLAFLFKALVENHLIDKTNQKSIFRVIGKSFESKAQEDISIGSIDSDFHSPTDKALDFWIDNFDKMQKIAIRMKQKKET